MISLRRQNGLAISLHPFGASWVSCQIPLADGGREVLLACREADLPTQSAYLGATVGRYANRIAGAAFSLSGRCYHLSANQDGKHTLHGGADNFAYRLWQVTSRSENRVVFALESPDDDQGFPGNLTATVAYTLSDNAVFIDYTATCDRDSVCSLSNHAYVNLDGQGDARRQSLAIPGEVYLPLDAVGIPSAELTHVGNTPFDFREPKPILQNFHAVSQPMGGYDHDWYVGDLGVEKPVARLRSADKRVALNLATTQPALRVYSGNFLAGTPDRYGRAYANYAGIALEAGCLANSPNHPDRLPDCWISPDKPYRHRVVYDFAWR